jgi:hypothetical protein
MPRGTAEIDGVLNRWKLGDEDGALTGVILEV